MCVCVRTLVCARSQQTNPQDNVLPFDSNTSVHVWYAVRVCAAAGSSVTCMRADSSATYIRRTIHIHINVIGRHR